MTTTEDETKDHEFTMDVSLPLTRCPLDMKFIRSLQKSFNEINESEIESAIEFLEAHGYKVIKN